MRVKKRLLGLGLAVLAMVGLTLTTAVSPASASTSVSGSLSCVTGRNVEGVWVAASSSTSGWATMDKASGSSPTVSWWYTLNNGGSYHINVGCGGTPQNWASSSSSYTTSGNLPDLICYDTTYEVPAGYQWTCQ